MDMMALARELRRLADKKDRGQISKSLIVELSLQIVLEELEKSGQRSINSYEYTRSIGEI